MRQTVLGVLAIALGFGCGEDLSPEDIPDIEGTWTVTESVEGNGNACRFIGTLDILQDGESFSGQFSRTSQCSYGLIPGLANSQTGSIVAGRIGRETVDYRIGDCDYRGVIVTDGRPDQVTGSVLCATIQSTGDFTTATGTWHADRVTE